MAVCSPSQALAEAFVKTDVAFRDVLNSRRKSKGLIQKDWHPGCTAITALIVKNMLFVANAGDCRTIICRGGNAYALSRVRLIFHTAFLFCCNTPHHRTLLSRTILLFQCVLIVYTIG